MTTEIRPSAGHGSAFQPGTDTVQQTGATLAEQTDATILVGRQGTRLRLLAMNTPKPVLPTAGHPFLEYPLGRIRAAGMKHVVSGAPYRAEVFEEHFGDGSNLGLEIEYVSEVKPLGTGGGIRNALDKPCYNTAMIFSGGILGGTDLRAMLGTHAKKDTGVTIYLVRVPDPRAFDCVPANEDGRVLEFLEKTQDPPTGQINTDIYVFRRRAIESIPAGRPISVEREIFPTLLDHDINVYGHIDCAYWRDMGIPGDFVRDSSDLVRGIAPSPLLEGKHGEALVDGSASVGGGTPPYGDSVVGREAEIGAGARIDQSVIFDDACIGADTMIGRFVIADGADIGPRAVISDTITSEGAAVGARCELINGIRVWPGVQIPDHGVRFSTDV